MIALWAGLCGGITVGVPVGPVGALALADAVDGVATNACALALGTVLAEAVVAVGLATAAAYGLPTQAFGHPLVRSAFALFLVAFGLHMMRRPFDTSAPAPTSPRNLSRFIHAVVLTVSNPAVALGYAAVLIHSNPAVPPGWRSTFWLFCGVVVGSGVWWVALIPLLFILKRARNTTLPKHIVRLIGATFAIAGCVEASRIQF
ncbi:MAG: LysE family transporter [Polyangiaceae bacterium]